MEAFYGHTSASWPSLTHKAETGNHCVAPKDNAKGNLETLRHRSMHSGSRIHEQNAKKESKDGAPI
ncbi:hypothetical protein E2C01_098945 [Portunus trituberculatus]|uniref:Uncharacterized protein n=1 Tax=Portunus trituberculatus TaxID=210409 RepID=A0A5B7K476_PORTR|nr:hypothetical protein [Portunus trituberculatus]